MNIRKNVFSCIVICSAVVSLNILAAESKISSTLNSPQFVFKKAEGSIVMIRAENGAHTTQGSGIVYEKADFGNGIVGVRIVSNAHVVVGASQVKVMVNGKSYEASNIIYDENFDLALLTRQSNSRL